jgi:hypothetical protein
MYGKCFDKILMGLVPKETSSKKEEEEEEGEVIIFQKVDERTR